MHPLRFPEGRLIPRAAIDSRPVGAVCMPCPLAEDPGPLLEGKDSTAGRAGQDSLPLLGVFLGPVSDDRKPTNVWDEWKKQVGMSSQR